MEIFANPARTAAAAHRVSDDPAPVLALLGKCPAYAETPLVSAAALAGEIGIGALHVKDERGRMCLGSFKALGAAYVIARDAAATSDTGRTALAGRTYATASAGNHGLSVAAGASAFGAQAVIYLAETVPEGFAERLRGRGARVVREGADYEASMAAAARDAAANGWTLLSDSTWRGYDTGIGVMEGYLALGAEVARQIPAPPTHVFLQAGVGGLAAAVAAFARRTWGEAPCVVVVEPAAAPALMQSARAGRAVHAAGPVSSMGRLDCKEPSLAAFEALSGIADAFVTMTDAEVEATLPGLAGHGLATSPSGGAGLAALFQCAQTGEFGLGPASRALGILSEGPQDA